MKNINSLYYLHYEILQSVYVKMDCCFEKTFLTYIRFVSNQQMYSDQQKLQKNLQYQHINL